MSTPAPLGAPPPQVARNGDVRLTYLDWGAASGSDKLPLLLIAGLGGGRHAYPAGYINALSAVGFHVATYDPRDVGASTRFTDTTQPAPWRALLGAGDPAYRAEDVVDDAVAVLDTLAWPRAHVFGMSYGGLMAQRLALRAPDRVATVTSMSAVPSDAGPIASLRHLRPGFVRATSQLDLPDTHEGDIETAVAVARLCASPAYPLDERALRAGLAAVPVEGVRDTNAQSRHLRAPWHGPRLGSLEPPLLVLYGEHDPVVRPSAARAISRAVPGARLELLAGVGHDLPEPLWPRLAQSIRANADRVGPTSTGSPDDRSWDVL